MGNSDSNIFVSPKLNAGLGNQMFMIANAYAYSLKYKINLVIPQKWKGMSDKRPSYWNTIFTNCNKYLQDTVKTKSKYKEPNFSYFEIPEFKESVKLEGYYQSEKYFLDYKNEIKKLFLLPDTLENFANQKFKEWNINDDEIIIAVHIRRGDYLKHINKHSIQSVNYYINSQKLIEEKINCKPRYLYFSDDMDWVQSNFKLDEKDILVKNFKDYEDFVLMKKCHHFIISNSSFSWWSSYLSNSSNEKIVIAPSVWFGSAGPRDWQSIYPKEWIIVDSKIPKFNERFFMGIISCEKYKDRRLTQDMKDNIFEYKYFIGNSDLSEAKEDFENNIVYLPCKDNYESLPEKVQKMLKWIDENRPQVEFVIKTDDDIKFNFSNLTVYCQEVFLKQINYAGIRIKCKEKYSNYHSGKTDDEIKKTKIPECIYCPGGCYFLSKKSVKILIDNLLKDNTIYEDQSVGHCLNKFNIYPHHFSLKPKTCNW